MKKLLLLLLVFTCSFSFATIYTFTGSGNWSSPSNWSGNIVPPSNLLSGDIIEIDGAGTCNLDISASLRAGVTLNIKSGKSLSLPGSKILTCYGTISNSGIITAHSIIYIMEAGSLQNQSPGVIELLSGGEIYFNGTTGSFINNGIIYLDDLGFGIYLGPIVLQNNGTINGNNGIQGTTNNGSSGVLNPGNGAGNLYFTSLTTSGVVNIQLGGAAQNSEYDVITALDNVNIDGGTLNVSLINGFIPASNQYFTIILNGTHSGTFSQVNFPFIAGVTWAVQYEDHKIIIHTLSTLPVQYLSFTGRPLRHEIELGWRTASEQNNADFTIEKSMDGVGWHTIGFTAANAQKNYSYTDQQPFAGKNYYRLQQRDMNGNMSYSGIINVQITKDKWSIYPNPAINSLWISGAISPDAVITIHSSAGVLVKKQKASKGRINISDLPPSLYLLQINENGRRGTFSFIKK
jgi:hypothetical protein